MRYKPPPLVTVSARIPDWLAKALEDDARRWTCTTSQALRRVLESHYTTTPKKREE